MTLEQAIELSGSLEKQYRGVLAVVDAMKHHRDLEQRIEQLQASKAEREKEARAVNAVLIDVSAKLLEARDNLAAAEDKAAQVSRDADAKARSIVEGAKAEAAAILQDARNEAETYSARAEAKVKIAERKVREAEVSLDALNAKAAVVQAKIDEFRKAIS